jgi:uncharacterized protein (DUF1697 family)
VTRFVAFLRGINVGGHTVKMHTLRECFTTLGFSDVTTFIASGNVIFTTDANNEAKLEDRITSHLEGELGYEVVTYLRSDAELHELANRKVFRNQRTRPNDTMYVGFLLKPASAATRRAVAALSNDDDVFELHGRDLYWLRHGLFSEATVSLAALNKALGTPTTIRNITTVRKLAAKYPPS